MSRAAWVLDWSSAQAIHSGPLDVYHLPWAITSPHGYTWLLVFPSQILVKRYREDNEPV